MLDRVSSRGRTGECRSFRIRIRADAGLNGFSSSQLVRGRRPCRAGVWDHADGAGGDRAKSRRLTDRAGKLADRDVLEKSQNLDVLTGAVVV